MKYWKQEENWGMWEKNEEEEEEDEDWTEDEKLKERNDKERKDSRWKVTTKRLKMEV
jgi:hypothetical protein